MNIQEKESSAQCEMDHPLKTKGVILITDNRPKVTGQKSSTPNFRESAFKQTQVDPLEVYMQINNHQEEESLIEDLNKRINSLEARVQHLEKTVGSDHGQEAVSKAKTKKQRRKFSQIQRQLKCPFKDCERVYGSSTSLKHHIRIKHPRDSK